MQNQNKEPVEKRFGWKYWQGKKDIFNLRWALAQSSGFTQLTKTNGETREKVSKM